MIEQALRSFTACAAIALAFVTACGGAAGPDEARQGQSNGVVHALLKNEDGTVAAEEWLNKATGATRRVEFEHVGGLPVRRVTVQDGSAIWTWSSADPDATSRVVYVAHADDPWLEKSSELLRGKRALAAGRGQVVATKMSNGRKTLSVRLEQVGMGTEGYAELDAETLLPVRFISKRDNMSQTLEVSVNEIPIERVSASLFSVETSPATKGRRLDYSDLAGTVPFAVYAAGPTYRGLRAGIAYFEERMPSEGQTIQLAPELFLGYVEGGPYSEAVIDISEQVATTPDAQARLSAFERAGKLHRVRILGVDRDVYLLDESLNPVYFAVVVDGTLVKGRAHLPAAELLAMLEDLRQVS